MKSKKNILVWTLVSLLFINYIGTNIMYGLYMIDQSLFVELFCENKGHPEEHCDGSCMLAKLGDHDHNHADHSSILDVYQVPLLFYIPETTIELLPSEEERFSFTFYENRYDFEFFPKKVHPPSIAQYFY